MRLSFLCVVFILFTSHAYGVENGKIQNVLTDNYSTQLSQQNISNATTENQDGELNAEAVQSYIAQDIEQVVNIAHKPRFVVINKLSSKSKLLRFDNMGQFLTFEDISIKVQECHTTQDGYYKAFVNIYYKDSLSTDPFTKLIFGDWLYYPVISKKIVQHQFYAVNFLGC